METKQFLIDCLLFVDCLPSWAKCLYDRPRTFDTSDDFDAWKFSGYPGLSYTAKDQCEILLRDHSAYEFVNGALSQVCENLHCRSPNRPGFFFAGPALQGTDCGNGRWCEGGTCQYRKQITTTTRRSTSLTTATTKTTTATTRRTTTSTKRTTTIRPAHNQNHGVCRSECLQHGKGIQKSSNEVDAERLTLHVCDDSKVCKTRKSIVTFGTERCKEFSKKIKEIDGELK
jgi:a disintegrin and metalloproteinase with thrombospondin motifs 18